MAASPYRKAVVSMAASSVCFAAMSALLRLAGHIDPFKTSLFRFAVGMAILGILAVSGAVRLTFTRPRLLLLRGVFGGLAVFLFFQAISRIGIARGTVITYSYPVFVGLLSAAFLGEPVRRGTWLTLFTSLFGIYLVAKGRGGVCATGSSRPSRPGRGNFQRLRDYLHQASPVGSLTLFHLFRSVGSRVLAGKHTGQSRSPKYHSDRRTSPHRHRVLGHSRPAAHDIFVPVPDRNHRLPHGNDPASAERLAWHSHFREAVSGSQVAGMIIVVASCLLPVLQEGTRQPLLPEADRLQARSPRRKRDQRREMP